MEKSMRKTVIFAVILAAGLSAALYLNRTQEPSKFAPSGGGTPPPAPAELAPKPPISSEAKPKLMPPAAPVRPRPVRHHPAAGALNAETRVPVPKAQGTLRDPRAAEIVRQLTDPQLTIDQRVAWAQTEFEKRGIATDVYKHIPH
jgi:hypothetical protein